MIPFSVGVERRDIESMYVAVTRYDGSVGWNAPVVLTSTCKLDVTYFPWDKQKCHQEFGSWSHDSNVLDIRNTTPTGDSQNFIDDGEWTLILLPVYRKVTVYNNMTFSTLVYTVHVQRNPMYYVVNIILPCVLITFCGLLVFLLPPNSGEKVSLIVTIVLASTVFLLIVADAVPPQSYVVPLLGR